MSKLDDIRHNLHVNELDNDSRKELLNKFKNAGGKIIQDDAKPGLMSFDRERQRKLKEELESNRKKPSRYRSDLGDEYGIEDEDGFEAIRPKFRLDFMTRILILFSGTISWFGPYLRKNFFRFFQSTALPAMREAELKMIDLFKINQEHDQKIQIELTKTSLIYFDLIEKFSNIYKEEASKNIGDVYRSSGGAGVRPKRLKDSFKILFKQLYILKPFQTSLYTALRIGLRLQDIFTGRQQAELLIKNIEKDIEIILNRLFYKLYFILLFIEDRKFYLFSDEMNEYLEIKDEEKVGFYRPDEILKKIKDDYEKKLNKPQLKPVSKEILDELKKIKEEKKNTELPAYVMNGLKIISQVNYTNWIKSFNEDNIRYNELTDKVFVIFILLKEFEYEYSFMLTSTKIVMNTLFENKERINYKDKLNDLYAKIDSITTFFLEYWAVMKDIGILDNDLSIDQISAFNKQQSLEAKRGNIALSIKKTVFDFFNEISSILLILLNDINANHRIIQNHEDAIHFDSSIEGIKKMNGKKVKEIIEWVRSYCDAVLFELDDAELLGGLKINLEDNYFRMLIKKIEELENLNANKNNQEPQSPDMTGEDEKNQEESDEGSNSLLRELDNFLK